MIRNRIVEPDWVCFTCAKERGAKVPEGHLCTVHQDLCGICGKITEVTEPRDFGRSRDLLKITIDRFNKNKVITLKALT